MASNSLLIYNAYEDVYRTIKMLHAAHQQVVSFKLLLSNGLRTNPLNYLIRELIETQVKAYASVFLAFYVNSEGRAIKHSITVN